MSGTVGIFHRGGGSVELQLLTALTEFLAYRGPDGQQTWADGSLGFGHAMLRTVGERVDDRYPAHLGDLWITADARLDSKSELTQQLEEAGQRIERQTLDSALILHAYAAWGSACVERLRGDFSFGLWDSSAKTLFCARDHFGVKPFYYAALGNLFLFSNTLNCLKQHPAVTNELNESAIGDFLLFGLNYDKATTTFRDIQRLPPAHWLMVSCDTLQMRCYWQPPTEGRIRYAHAQDYVDRFSEILKVAVSDRLPSDRAGILLSGGLDSGSVAVTASELSMKCGGMPGLCSYTAGYESLISDNEGPQARTTANYLGIPNKYLALDHVELFDKWEDSIYRFPEPVGNPLSAGLFEQLELMSLNCRVALSGEGPDNLMYFQMLPYIRELRRNRQWSRLLVETAWFLWVRPLPWLGAARRVRSLFRQARGGLGIPPWIAPEFAKRARLDARWKECISIAIPSEPHLSRPKAHASMLLPHWSNMFECQDPGATRFPVEIRYPFLDLRMVDYLLGVPAFPWLYKKKLIRKAMIDRLPETIRRRPKTPLSADPVTKKLLDSRGEWMNRIRLEGQVCEFISNPVIPRDCDRIGPEQVRPFCLYLWLKRVT